MSRGVGLLLVLGPLGEGRSAPGQEPAASASQILARVNATYAQARSYRDEGRVATVLVNQKNEKQTVERPFATAFERPNRFRFEFVENPDSPDILQRFVVWTERGPEAASRWWTLRPQVQTGRLDLWLAGGKTLSGGSTLAIPQLLFPGLSNKMPRITDLKQPMRLADETIDGAVCYVVQEPGPTPDESVTLWIGQADALVRQVTHRSRNGEFRVEDTMSFHPRLNVPIPAELTRFTPAAK
jgi:hypothetical protein